MLVCHNVTLISIISLMTTIRQSSTHVNQTVMVDTTVYFQWRTGVNVTHTASKPIIVDRLLFNIYQYLPGQYTKCRYALVLIFQECYHIDKIVAN